MNEKRLSVLREALEHERANIESTAAERASASATVTLDQQAVGRLSRMDAMQQQEMAKAEATRARERLRLIKLALDKIESSDYGLCTECDELIAEGRLQANPAAELCITCAEARQSAN